jgi:hypothetical protein
MIDQGMDHVHRVMEREPSEIDLGRENFIVTSMEVRQDTRSWIHDDEMMEGAEETTGGQGRELFQPLRDNHLAVADVDTTDEHVKTLCDKGGVKVAEFRD